MGKKKMNTKLAVVIIIVFVITAGIFVWKYEEIRYKTSSQNDQRNIASRIENNQEELSKEQNIPEAIEYPTIAIAYGVSLEEIIRQAIFKKFPDLKAKNFNITVTVETNKENHAIGRFAYDGYNVVKDGTYQNTGEGIWFASEENQAWTLVGTSYPSYWGICQDFKKYKFTSDMTPDCWDNEKNILIDTPNPTMFYRSSFTKSDKTAIIKSFLDYYKRTYRESEGRDFYLNKKLYLKIDKNTDKYFKGRIFVGGVENHSTPYALAVKENGIWKFLYQSQDMPPCSIVEPYGFPREIIDKCYDEINKTEKEII